MYRVEETIIVEGVYDKIKLSGFIDSVILTTGGFSVFNNKKLQNDIKLFAKKTGIVILSDSDSAGLKIRNFIKQLSPDATILHAYIPSLKGREKRKTKDSKEGLLGVEGMSKEIIIDALKKAGATINGVKTEKKPNIRILTKADMYKLGLTGKANSTLKRSMIAKELGFSQNLSSNMFMDVINRILTFDELIVLSDKFDEEMKK